MFLFDYLLVFFSMGLLIIMVLVGVAFLTLFERKVLGYIQLRKGPNVLGLLQPFSDAFKLFTKEQMFPYMSNFFIYYFSPVVNLFISLFLWMVMPFLSVYLNFNFSLLFFLCVSSLGVYSVMMAGWSSNSSYSLLGSLRSVAQTISYEVSLALIMMSLVFLVLSFSFFDFKGFQNYFWFIYIGLPLFMIWLVSGLAETNRTPFDFAEGESELVSGFNVEYSSGGFAMIFLAEYSSILFMSMVTVIFFLGGDFGSFMFFVKLSLISYVWIWVRGSFPRFRYDKLMYLSWKSFLPVSLSLLMFYFGFKVFIFVLLL